MFRGYRLNIAGICNIGGLKLLITVDLTEILQCIEVWGTIKPPVSGGCTPTPPAAKDSILHQPPSLQSLAPPLGTRSRVGSVKSPCLKLKVQVAS